MGLEHGTGHPAVCLEASGLTIGFGRRRVLADLDFKLPLRGVTVLMGPGGTGKSTLLHWLAGRSASRRFHHGETVYMGAPLDTATLRPALVQQHANLLGGRLADVLGDNLRSRISGGPAERRKFIARRLEELGATFLLSALDTVVSDLPLAHMRAAALLQAAATGSQLLLIDEPTHGLDQTGAARIIEMIRRLGNERACLVSTHHQGHARQIADQAMLLAGGRIQALGPASDFLRNAQSSPVLSQFLHTGSCSVPGLDADPTELTDDPTQMANGRPLAVAVPGPGAEEAIAPANTASQEPGGESDPGAASVETVAALPASAFGPIAGAPPSSLGPTGFHWLVPGRLAGCAKPGVVHAVDHDLGLLRNMGITLLINLTEHPFPQEDLSRHGLKGYALRIQDRHAPPCCGPSCSWQRWRCSCGKAK